MIAQKISKILGSSEFERSTIRTEFADMAKENIEICNITLASPDKCQVSGCGEKASVEFDRLN